MPRIFGAVRVLIGAGLCLLAAAPSRGQTPPPLTQLNQNCTVSVLNRNVRVRADGSWVLPNVPANFGFVRARATCIINGETISGESDPFLVPPNGVVNLPKLVFNRATPIPLSLTIAPTGTITIGGTVQLAVTARYSDGSQKDVTPASTGTQYLVSNTAIATVSTGGLVGALKGGTVLVQATNEGATGMTAVQVILSGADSDGDGMPDDYEIAHGFDPNNAIDGQEDPDRDGLTNAEEYRRGTDPRNADTDGDGLKDGDEVNIYHTNPLLWDSDGDGISDGLEVRTGSDPLDPASQNLSGALASIRVTPPHFTLTFNTVIGEASVQLKVTGTLLDGRTIDLTSSGRGTNFASDSLAICSFGGRDGQVFAGENGGCTITATSHTFTATATGDIAKFSPTALGSVAIPGYANNVDVNGHFAYIAAGSRGLFVVDASTPSSPQIVGAVDTPGNANDVRVIGNLAYVADGPSGLQIIDVTDPAAPRIVGAVDTPGDASDVIVAGPLAYIADGAAGLQILDVSVPSAPKLVRSVATPGTARGVDVDASRSIVVVVSDYPVPGLQVVDVSNPSAPRIAGQISLADGGQPTDVSLGKGYAYVADYAGGVRVVDVRQPAAPVVVGQLSGNPPFGFVPRDVQFAGQFAIFAEQVFANAIAPIVDVSDPAHPIFRAFIDFGQDYAGTGIAVSGPYVYWTGQSFFVGNENGTDGNTRLFIGQYLALEDRNGVPPSVSITAPANGAPIVVGTKVTVRATAADDVAVSSVTFMVNGQEAFVDTSEPYEYTFTAPSTPGTLIFSAIASDLGNNTTTAQDVTISIVPDPLTTVVGRVLDPAGQPIDGVTVNVLSHVSQTAADGTFAIPGVPTLRPFVIVEAALVRDGQTILGNSVPTVPVPAGNTDVGDIVAVVTTFETQLGTLVSTCRYCDVSVTLPFGFPMAGGLRHQIRINDGYVYTPEGDTIEVLCCPGMFADAGNPASGVYVNDQLPGRWVATWYRETDSGGGGGAPLDVRQTITAQATLFADGRIQLGYQNVKPLGFAEVGVFPAGRTGQTAVDLSADSGLTIGAGRGLYEDFNLSDHPFDLAGGFVVFTPNASAGYDVRPVADLMAPACTVTPANGTILLEGQRIQVAASATDNGAVARMRLQSTAGGISIDQPGWSVQVPFVVPAGVSAVTFTATAYDEWGNSGTCTSTVSVIPDPLTTVVGRVVDAQGQPLAGAIVSVLARASQTGGDGVFSIPDVPTLQVSIIVSATLVQNGQTIAGVSGAVPAVRGGTTSVGDIVATATRFETSLGTLVATCCDLTVPLPFDFPLAGGVRQQIHVNDGYVWTNEGDEIDLICCPGLQADPNNPLSGVYVNDTLPGRFVVTWYREAASGVGGGEAAVAAVAAGGGGGAPLDVSQTVTAQLILFADGRMQFGYQGVTPPGWVDTAVFVANSTAFTEVDFSAGALTTSAGETVFEGFNPFGHPFDLSGGFVVFAPNAAGGYDIRPVPDVTAPMCTVTPADGSVLFGGEPIQVVANATDNGTIAHVQIHSSTGLDVDQTTRPFQAALVVPVGETSITFTASAYDVWGNLGVCASTVSVVAGPPPTLTMTSVAAGATLIAGATVPITIDAANRVPVTKIDFSVNGVLLSTDAAEPFEFLFTVPAGVDALVLSAVATDSVGKTGASDPVSVLVAPDPLTTVLGRTVDRTSAPIVGADVTAAIHGATVEIFNSDTALAALPDLTGKTPDTITVVSAINLRNPGGMFGADPFGFGTSASRATRITATLQTLGANTYTFTLGVKAGGRLVVNGATVVDLPNDTGQFQEGTGTINVAQSTLSIEILTFDNGNPEVRLSYAVPGVSELRVVPTAELTSTLVPYRATSQADGTFTIPGVPTTLGAITVTASKVIGGRNARGHSSLAAPVAGGATDVGDVTLTAGGRIGYYDLSNNSGSGNQVQAIATAGLQAIDVGDLNAADLSQFDVLFVQNPDNGGYSFTYRNNLARINQFIAEGGTLIFHDRAVSGAASILPGSPGTFVRAFTDDRNINVVDDTTLVTHGPGGTVTNDSLDNGNSSSHGWIDAATVPAGARGILSQGDPNHLVTYTYPFGLGHVIYSTIPLDFYLGGGNFGLSGNMQIYAANVVAFANDQR